jgi:hypothetical protein
MGRKHQFHLVPSDIDVRVMIHVLCFLGDSVHKIDRLLESAELEGSLDAVLAQLPIRYLAKQVLNCFRSE